MAERIPLVPLEAEIIHRHLRLGGLHLFPPERRAEIYGAYLQRFGHRLKTMMGLDGRPGDAPAYSSEARFIRGKLHGEERKIWDQWLQELDQWTRRVENQTSTGRRLEFLQDSHAVLEGFSPRKLTREEENEALDRLSDAIRLSRKRDKTSKLNKEEQEKLDKANSEEKKTRQAMDDLQAGRETGASVIAGIAGYKDAFSRIRTAATMARLPDEVRMSPEQVRQIIEADDHKSQMARNLTPRLNGILPALTEIDPDVAGRLSPEYLSNLFLYHRDYEKESPEARAIFAGMNTAYLEGGVAAAKKFKFDSKHAQEVYRYGRIPKDVTAFIQDLDQNIGTIRANTDSPKIQDLYGLYKGKLEDHATHLEGEDPDIGAAQKQLKQDAQRVLEEIENQNPALFGDMRKSLERGRPQDALSAWKDAHKKAKGAVRNQMDQTMVRSGLKDRLMAPLRSLADIDRIPDLDKIGKAVQAGKQIVDCFRQLEGQPLERQRQILQEARNAYAADARKAHADVLSKLPKAVFADYRYFMDELENAGRNLESGQGIESEITHNPQEHFTVGKFEKNCQGPGISQNNGLISYSADPHELVIAHRELQDSGQGEPEMVGFTFAHVLQGREKGTFAIAFERPYTNSVKLKPKMKDHLDRMIAKINAAASQAGIALVAEHATNLKGKKFRVIEGHAPKYYDMAGGTVQGGREL